MRIFITVQFFVYYSICFAQQINLNGIITIHNSEYKNGKIEYVSNAEIIAAFSTPSTSDNNGNFSLEFVGVEGGTSVNVNVEKYGYEVVNKRALQDVVISRRLPLKVFLAPTGELAKAQTELYNVSVKALTARHDALIKALQKEGAERRATMAVLEDKLGKTIADRFEAEQLLNEQLVATKKRLPAFAKELALVNLDFASDMYRKAYEFFKQGEIEKAIETLDEAVLDKEAVSAFADLEILKKDINELDSIRMIERQILDTTIASIVLKSEAHTNKEEFQDAIDIYKNTLLKIKRTEYNDQGKLAQIYGNLAENYQKMGVFEKELYYRLKQLNIREAMQEQAPEALLKEYERISQLYLSEHDLGKVIFYEQKIYEILKTIPAVDAVELQRVKSDLVDLLQQYGEKLQQQNNLTEALKIYNEVLLLEPSNKQVKRTVRKLKKSYQ